MKRLSIAVLAMVLMAVLSTSVWAKPEELTVKVSQMKVAIAKNGKEYVRFIAPIQGKSESGVVFEQELPVMAFGELATVAKQYKEGQTFKCIADSRFWNGRKSYTILKFLK
jgi:hypothetical protein